MRRPRWSRRRLTQWIRRVHLYLGLALVPWVFLYGITALLFNHSDWFTDYTRHPLGDAELHRLPDPQQTAQALVKERLPADFTQVEDSARWVGHLLLRGKTDDARALMVMHPSGSGGVLKRYPNSDETPEWGSYFEDWTALEQGEESTLLDASLSVAQTHDPGLESLSVRDYPELRFQVRDADGRLYTVNLESGGEAKIAVGEGVAPLRSRLLRLHVAHGSPGYTGVVWAWSRVVDVMGSAMLLWGTTGLIMWWTILPTRRSGAWALAGGMTTMGLLAISFWTFLGLI